MFPLSAYHLCNLLTQQLGILAHQFVGAYLHGLYVLGVAVQRDAGHVVESSFLGHVSRVGDDAFGMGREIAELKVGK